MKIRFAVATTVLSTLTALAATPKPNILMIVGDDMGYADVGFHGCKDIPTPNLDALAASGVKFTSGYVTGPYCSPTRAGLMTGRYQTRFGHEFNPGGGGQGMPVTEKTIADRMKAAGYTTGLVGKWHLGAEPEMRPMKRGFDTFFGFLGGANSYKDAGAYLRGDEPVKEIGYSTDAFGREAVAYIDRHKGQPWFLYLAFNAVHTPMQATDDRLEKFKEIKDTQRRTYAAMMSAMDDAIGVVIKKLKEEQLDKNTLVTFISDNGGPVMKGVTINGSVNAPLRGSKRTTLEGGIRVPFVMSWPGTIKPGVYEKPVIQLDLTATAATLAGASTEQFEGVNLLPYLSGEKKEVPHTQLCWRFGRQMAIREGSYKLVRYDINAIPEMVGKNEVTPFELYDLSKDIGEKDDLAKALPDKVKELQDKWAEWDKLNVPPLWGGAHVQKKDNDGPEPGAKAGKKKKK